MKRNLVIIRVLAMIAFALSAYILWTSASQSAELAGCGEGSGCETVLQTKWASWFGIPVSAGALFVYGAIFVLTFVVSTERRQSWPYLVFFSVLASGSGLWFLLLQVFLIKSYCIYCSIVHFCGILITILVFKTLPAAQQQAGKKKKTETQAIPASRNVVYAALFGIFAVGIVAVGQMKSGSTEISELPQATTAPVASVPARTVRLLNGALPVTVGEFPLLGPIEEDRVIAHLFDYTCPACRKLHPDLLRTLQSNQQSASLAMIPMPLDAECNPGLSQTSYQHQNACAFAKLGLAIWRTKPDAYAAYDRMMFETQHPPSLEQARAIADKLVGRESISNALADPALSDVLRDGISIFYSPALQRKVLPILLTPEKAVYGIPKQPELTTIFEHH